MIFYIVVHGEAVICRAIINLIFSLFFHVPRTEKIHDLSERESALQDPPMPFGRFVAMMTRFENTFINGKSYLSLGHIRKVRLHLRKSYIIISNIMFKYIC